MINQIISSDGITIIFSTIAIIISILAYFINRRNLKINAQNLEIVMQKQDKLDNLESLLRVLKNTSNKLSKLPELMYIGWIDEFISQVIQEVYDHGKCAVNIEFTYISISANNEKIPISSIESEQTFKKIYNSIFKSEIRNNFKHLKSPSLHFETNIQNLPDEWFELVDIVGCLEDLDEIIVDLEKFELVVDSLDSDLLRDIQNSSNNLLSLFYSLVKKKPFQLEFNKNMKRDEIKLAVYDEFNLTQMRYEAIYLSDTIKARINDMKEKIVTQIY